MVGEQHVIRRCELHVVRHCLYLVLQTIIRVECHDSMQYELRSQTDAQRSFQQADVVGLHFATKAGLHRDRRPTEIEFHWPEECLLLRNVLETQDGNLAHDIIEHGRGRRLLEVHSGGNVRIEIRPTFKNTCDIHLWRLHEARDVAFEAHVQAEVRLQVRLIEPHVPYAAGEDVLELRVPRRVRVVIPIPIHLADLLRDVQVEHAVVLRRPVWR
mmetsp:Transcript_23642/g.71016  ORF Transcript_23642/g.71016 Transcript_23642/m.71016 type:complete len:214 (-) Transcript_23642:554-1195(-)